MAGFEEEVKNLSKSRAQASLGFCPGETESERGRALFTTQVSPPEPRDSHRLGEARTARNPGLAGAALAMLF